MASKKDYTSMDDVALFRAAQRGNMPAFEELVARHRDKIYARAFSMIRNEEDAVDLSQEAWVKAWQRLKQFQGDSSFLTWMTRIVINLCLDKLRKQKRERAESIENAERMQPGQRLPRFAEEFFQQRHRRLILALEEQSGRAVAVPAVGMLQRLHQLSHRRGPEFHPAATFPVRPLRDDAVDAPPIIPAI